MRRNPERVFKMPFFFRTSTKMLQMFRTLNGVGQEIITPLDIKLKTLKMFRIPKTFLW